jgi:hypothetical protein
MRFENLYSLCVLEKVAYHIECRTKLHCLLRSQVDGDDREVLVLPSCLTTQSHPTVSWAVPAMVHG